MRSILSRFKYYAAMALFLLTSTVMTAGPAVLGATTFADPLGKVFVCKYVGTPGVDERLQTGNNPIDVSINAIKDYNGVGSYFNDAQNRSYVLALDVGQTEPDVSACPAAPPTTATPATIAFADHCGTTNDTFTIPTTTGVDYQVGGVTIPAATHGTGGASSVTVTAVPQAGFTLTGNTTQTLTFTDNAPCEVPPTPVTPATIAFADHCGTTNDTFTIPTTTGVDYQVGGVTIPAATHGTGGASSVTVTAVPQAGFTLTGNTTQTLTFTDVPCVQTNQKVFVCKYVGTPGVDERLQTGQNPISVSVNAVRESPVVIGSFFNDAQGRSYVLAFDIGQTEPDASACPAATPTPVTPATIATADHCGTTNDTFTIPTTTGVSYQVNGVTVAAGTHHTNGALSVTVTAVPQAGFTLTGNTTQTLTFTDVPCEVSTPPTNPIVVVTHSVCVPPSSIAPTGSITVRVTNPNTHSTTYTVVIGLVSQHLTLAGGATGSVTFNNLAAGSYAIHISGSDTTSVNTHATLTTCGETTPPVVIPPIVIPPVVPPTVPPTTIIPPVNSGGGGQVLGASTTLVSAPSVVSATPSVQAVLTDTGVSTLVPTILALSMAITATGVMFGNRKFRNKIAILSANIFA